MLQTLKDDVVYSETSFEYSSSYPWQQTKITDPLGNTTTTLYDTHFLIYPVLTTNAKGYQTSIDYDFNTNDSSLPNKGWVLGLPVKSTNPNGAITYSVYDVFGRIASVYLPGNSPADGSMPNKFFSYHYYNENDGISPCNSTTHCLIGLGNNNTPKLLIGEAVRYSGEGETGQFSGKHVMYNGLGQQVQTRSTWMVNDFTSDLGIPVEGEGLKDLIVSTSFNALGQVEYQSLPYTSELYIYPNNSYDPRDFIYDPDIGKSSYTYDGLGRNETTTYPDSTVDSVVYEINNDPLKTKILNKNCNDDNPATPCTEKVITNDAFGRTLNIQEIQQGGPNSYTTTYTIHPVLGSPTEIRDTNGNLIIKTIYDTLGRKIKMWDIDMSPAMTGDENSWRYEYDIIGNIKKQTNPKGVVSEIKYEDPLNRPTKNIIGGATLSEITYDNCTNGKGMVCNIKSYDLTRPGKLVESITFQYNLRGLATNKTKVFSNMPDTAINGKAFTTSYTYDEGGRAKTTTLPSESGTFNIGTETLTYNYNRPYLSQIQSSIGSVKYIQNATYNKNAQPTTLELGNGITNAYIYNSANMLLNQITITGANLQPIDGINNSYYYDPLGNISTIQDLTGRNLNDPFSFEQAFVYDHLNRVTEVTGAYTASFNYDNIGNIITKNEGSDSVSLTYGSYDPNNISYYHRPQSITNNGETSTMLYDEVGNLIKDHQNEYQYDFNNRMVQSTSLFDGFPAASPVPTHTWSNGDANGDGVVDEADYEIWLSNYGIAVEPGILDAKELGDFNYDGVVDGLDYNIWRTNYSNTKSPTATTALENIYCECKQWKVTTNNCGSYIPNCTERNKCVCMTENYE